MNHKCVQSATEIEMKTKCVAERRENMMSDHTIMMTQRKDDHRDNQAESSVTLHPCNSTTIYAA